MISFLRGTLQFKKPPALVIDVAGIGYECLVPMPTFCQLPEIGQDIFLYTHFAVREDAHTLYGFSQQLERTLFRSLIKVNNVGPKLALAILSGIESDNLVHCIRQQDLSSLTRIPGVGKKTAERLLIELRDRLPEISPHGGDQIATTSLEWQDQTTQDAISALVALGFKSQEASRMAGLVKVKYQSAEELIRLALQSKVKGG